MSTNSSADGGGIIQQLPDDLLALVYRRLGSPLGRARFAAVCRSWRTVASWILPPPPLPLLLLSMADGARAKDFYCPEDGGELLLRLRLPRPAAGAAAKWVVGSHDGGWVALASPGAQIQILNLFSRAEVPLSAQILPTHYQFFSSDPTNNLKVIFSAEPTSPGCILAAVTVGGRVALCRVNGRATNDDKTAAGWTTMEGHGGWELTDVAFCNGELYGLDLNRHENVITLLKLGISVDDDEGGGGVVITGVHAVVTQSLHLLLEEPEDDVAVKAAYIFRMHGDMPAMAVGTGEHVFRVFDLVKNESPAAMPATGYDYRWAEMTDLGDYALFLSPRCSRAVEVSPAGGGVQRNRIYYANYRRRHLPVHSRHLTKMADGRDVYYKEGEIVCRDGKVIISKGFFGQRGVQPAMWLVPPGV